MKDFSMGENAETQNMDRMRELAGLR